MTKRLLLQIHPGLLQLRRLGLFRPGWHLRYCDGHFNVSIEKILTLQEGNKHVGI